MDFLLTFKSDAACGTVTVSAAFKAAILSFLFIFICVLFFEPRREEGCKNGHKKRGLTFPLLRGVNLTVIAAY